MARPLAKRGQLDVGRLNRAFGLCQSKDPHFDRYGTTLHTCRCPDFVKAGRVCKHVFAKQLLEVAKELAK